jgi:hypothetical protein
MKLKFSIMLFLLTVFFAFSSARVYALGADIVFDPSTYAQAVKLYQQGVQLWETTKKSLDTLHQIQTTVEQAKEGVDALKNFDLKKTASNLASGSSGQSDKISALRSQMSNIEGGVSSNASYLKYQAQRVRNLENLEILQKQSSGNLGKASDKTSTDANNKITAQSTSTMAALMAAEAQRNQEADMQAASDAERRRNLTGGASELYGSIGK